MKNGTKLEDRRAALKVLGGLGAVLLLDCSSDALGTSSGGDVDAGAGDGGVAEGSAEGAAGDAAAADSAITGDANASCVLNPNVTKGPYWIDEKLERSDVTSDSNNKASPNPRPGLPLTIKFTVVSYDNGTCAPLAGAQIDIWHCDATGVYSDVANMGGVDATGENFLRGYQVTDSSGAVQFISIYPGWYSGRAVHIHVKVRIFDATSNTTTEATTQIFFDDTTTDAVFAATAPYNTRGARDTRNSNDMIYGNQTVLLANLVGDATSGYTASATIGVKVGTVSPG